MAQIFGPLADWLYAEMLFCAESVLPAQPPSPGTETHPVHTFDQELSDHVIANHIGHMTRMLAATSWHLDAPKGLGGSNGKGLMLYVADVCQRLHAYSVQCKCALIALNGYLHPSVGVHLCRTHVMFAAVFST